MGMFKRTKVVMLPTNKEVTQILKMKSGLGYNPFLKTHKNDSYQHLYFLLDNEIKEGDWCYSDGHRDVERVTANPTNVNNSKGYYKVIATTDKSLKLYEAETIASASGFTQKTNDIYLPEPSQGFIKKYCEKGGIDEVMVEYEYPLFAGIQMLPAELKVSSNNTITIKSVKDSWNREEIDSMLHQFGEKMNIPVQRTTIWIENNL